jgi:hypothetical protein
MLLKNSTVPGNTVHPEKPLETDILNQFFKQIGVNENVPTNVVEALLQLRKEGLLTDTNRVSAAIRSGADVKG